MSGSARTLTFLVHRPGSVTPGAAVAVPESSATVAVALTATTAPTTAAARPGRSKSDFGAFMFSRSSSVFLRGKWVFVGDQRASPLPIRYRTRQPPEGLTYRGACRHNVTFRTRRATSSERPGASGSCRPRRLRSPVGHRVRADPGERADGGRRGERGAAAGRGG